MLFRTVLQWICEHWVEIFAVASSILYICLEIRQRSSMWVVGFISSAVYAGVFFQSYLYAFSALYVYYMAASVYGMYCWRYAKNADDGSRPVCRLDWNTGIVLSLISAVLFAIIWYVLDTYISPDTLVIPPYSEALAVALSIVATWMLAKKILEQWLVWIFVNFFSSALYFLCQLYPTSALFIIYGIMSVAGWLHWKKSLKLIDN